MTTTLPTGTPAHIALTPGARRGVVIIPDIGGLRPLFTDLCDRLAADNDWSVVCFEPWAGRTELSIEERLASVGTLDDDVVLGDLIAAADVLDVEPVAAIGFCMGGMFALKAAAVGRIDRAVSFYGMVRLPPHWATDTVAEPLDSLASDLVAPVLMIVGTEDPWVSAADADDLEATGAEVVRYDGADHGFVHDPDRPAHRAEHASDAWARVTDFLGVED